LKPRLAIVVSHPIQYYVPLYRQLAGRGDVDIRVFFTWHGGESQQFDPGFESRFAWDIPITDGYESEVAPNVSRNPGTHSFWGLQNPSLISRLYEWKADVVHVTGFRFASHLNAIRTLARNKVPTLFRGDSHLLNETQRGLRWHIKRYLMTKIYSWPSICLYVGTANKAYYKAFGIHDDRLRYCPHSINIKRFVEADAEFERLAAQWRADLGIDEGKQVLLFVGKFQDKKRPVELMKAFIEYNAQKMCLVMIGGGPLGDQVRALARMDPQLFRLVPFQNQSQMPVVYRLGDFFVLPSAYDETWGLAVNEALACGRPAIVSDKVGGAADLISTGFNGEIFTADNWQDFRQKLDRARNIDWRQQKESIRSDVQKRYSLNVTEETLMNATNELI
jgi:glycosyltransferase involved in cell wall biosynthesis